MKKRWYVGLLKYPRRELFQSTIIPTEESHGYRYKAVIGPFRTKLAAVIMAKHGTGNPHIQHVADAEKLARYGIANLREMGFDV